MMARTLLTPRWIITTLLVIVAVGVMVRLGFWQLDRLAERRAFNTRVQAQVDAPPIDLNQTLPVDQLYDMEYRQVIVRGEFDPANSVILRNQVHDGRPGYHLLTPFKIAGSEYAVLVDRGYIPMEDSQPEQWSKHAVTGEVTLEGVIQRAHVPRMFGVPDPTLAPGQNRLDAWNAPNLERIQEQVPYPLVPVLVAAEANPNNGVGFPLAQVGQPDLSEGSHMGYAIQWFAFAGILGLGYPFFVRSQICSRSGDRRRDQQLSSTARVPANREES